MRILSTAIEELSHRSSNIAAASHMRIQEMLRTLSIEEKFGHIFVSGSLNHAGHISEFELEISPYGRSSSISAAVRSMRKRMPADISSRCVNIWHSGSSSCRIIWMSSVSSVDG